MVRPREVLVFISSPGDCGIERGAARRIVTELNGHPQVVRQRVRFRPLLWEDLPPGVAADGDFQNRINLVMRRLGYDAYGIYVGFMRGRLGTPTPRHPSGTIEELEASLEAHRRRGMPSEVLFYFLLPEAADAADVRAFRDQLAERGLLAASVAAAEFPDRLAQNLLEIATSWSDWANILRRSWRRFGFGAAVAVGLLAVSLAVADLGSRWRIERTLEDGEVAEAARLWRELSVVMPMSGDAARERINAAAARMIGAAPPLERQLGALAEWRRNPAYLPAPLAPLREDLATRTVREIEAGVLEQPDRRGLALWRAARAADLWADGEEPSTRLLRLLASSRLLGALMESGLPPERWRGALIRPEEASALETLARNIVQRTPDLGGWPDGRLRVAVAIAAGDMELLARLATSAARGNSHDLSSVAAYLSMAPPEAAAAWLQAVAAPTLPTPVVGRMIDGIRARAEPAMVAALAGLVRDGRLPEGDNALLDGLSCPLPACAGPATERLAAWAGDGAALPEGALALLLPALDPGRLTPVERERVARAVLALAQTDKRSAVMIRALSELGTDTGLRFLDSLIEEHVGDRIAFGFAEREALIDHLRRRGERPSRLAAARTIVHRSEKDVETLGDGSGIRPWRPDIGGVERAYLDLLAEGASAATAEDRALLERIVARAVGSGGPLNVEARTAALGRALLALPSAWRDALFGFQPPPLLDPPWFSAWSKRRLLLQAIGRTGGPAPANLAATVFRTLPNDGALATEFAGLAAAIDREAGRRFFRERLANGDRDALVSLGELGDGAALAAYVEAHARELGTASGTAGLKRVADAIGALDEDARKPLLSALLALSPPESAVLLPLAASTGMDRPALRAAALGILRQPAGAAELVMALRYLAAVAPAELWSTLADKTAVDGLANWLTTADAFDWVTAAQEFPDPPDGRLPDEAARLAKARLVLVTLDTGAHLRENAAAGWMALDDARRVVNHLLVLAARHADPGLAQGILQAAAEGSGSVAGLNRLGDAETVFRAYTTWLAAMPVRAQPPACLSPTWFGIERLDDANPLVVRVASALVLASPEAAARPACASSG